MLLIVSWTNSWAAPQKINLNKGEKAPFDGVLLSRAALATIISDYEARIRQATIDLERERKESQARIQNLTVSDTAALEAEKKKLHVLEVGCKSQMDLMHEALQKCETRRTSFWKSPYFNFFIGSLITGGVCAAASYGLRR